MNVDHYERQKFGSTRLTTDSVPPKKKLGFEIRLINSQQHILIINDFFQFLNDNLEINNVIMVDIIIETLLKNVKHSFPHLKV